MRINGISTVVTGAASGLGLATAARLVKEGAFVVLVDLSTSEGAKRAEELGDSARFVAADVTTGEGALTVAEHVSARGGAQILVHVAGGSSAPQPRKQRNHVCIGLSRDCGSDHY